MTNSKKRRTRRPAELRDALLDLFLDEDLLDVEEDELVPPATLVGLPLPVPDKFTVQDVFDSLIQAANNLKQQNVRYAELRLPLRKSSEDVIEIALAVEQALSTLNDASLHMRVLGEVAYSDPNPAELVLPLLNLRVKGVASEDEAEDDDPSGFTIPTGLFGFYFSGLITDLMQDGGPREDFAGLMLQLTHSLVPFAVEVNHPKAASGLKGADANEVAGFITTLRTLGASRIHGRETLNALMGNLEEDVQDRFCEDLIRHSVRVVVNISDALAADSEYSFVNDYASVLFANDVPGVLTVGVDAHDKNIAMDWARAVNDFGLVGRNPAFMHVENAEACFFHTSSERQGVKAALYGTAGYGTVEPKFTDHQTVLRFAAEEFPSMAENMEDTLDELEDILEDWGIATVDDVYKVGIDKLEDWDIDISELMRAIELLEKRRGE